MATGAGFTPWLADRVVLGVAAVCLGALTLTGWAMFARAANPREAAAAGRLFTGLRCSTCGNVIPYSPALDGRECEECDDGGVYTPITDAAGARRPRPWGKIAVFLLIALVLIAGTAHVIVLRVRAVRRAEERERHRRLVTRCPYCDRKLRYPASSAGTAVVCSLCKTAYLLPFEADASEPSASPEQNADVGTADD